MTERLITADCIDAVALAEAPVKQGCAEKTDTDNTVKFCVSDGSESYPVALPEGADVALLKQLSGAVEVQELQYGVAGSVYKKAAALRDHHVYEIFPAGKLASFVEQYGLHR